MRSQLTSLAQLAVVGLIALAIDPAGAQAASWCAQPLYVHEWGVQAFDSSGAPQSPVALPTWFHRSASGSTPAPSPVRHMRPDGGTRFLPVLHFYGSRNASIPVGIEVGFTQGEASVWYPQVNHRRSARDANGTAAHRARRELLRARQARRPFGGNPPLGRDPTRQLHWDRLMLSAQPTHTPHADTGVARVLRALDAMWVNGQSESERFVFYEAQTQERVALRMERGPQWSANRRHLIVHNDGGHAVHDVFLTHRESGRTYVIFVPQIPARRSAGFILEEHAVAPADLAAQTRARLRARLLEPSRQTVGQECTMMRDPAIPEETAAGHRLRAGEVDVIEGIWGATFFDAPGTTIVYREDTGYLDSVMPLSIYTDMYNYVVLHRAGLAVWSGVSLP